MYAAMLIASQQLLPDDPNTIRTRDNTRGLKSAVINAPDTLKFDSCALFSTGSFEAVT